MRAIITGGAGFIGSHLCDYLLGKGFEVVDASARVSLANLTNIEYAAIGRFTRQVLDEYFTDFQRSSR